MHSEGTVLRGGEGDDGVGLTESRPSVKGRQSSSRHVETMLIDVSGVKPFAKSTVDMHS